MAICDMCGNDYDGAMQLTVDGKTHTFDSFECAIHAVAPRCSHCGCTILGHGLQADDNVFCCAHCARESGVESLADRA
jgi:nitrite reductase/ring-hydroxylating ferredoxin subunit